MSLSRPISLLTAASAALAASLGLAACSSSSASTGTNGTATTAAPQASTPTSAAPAPAPAPQPNHAFVTSLGRPVQIGSTVPSNGDGNPYGIAIVKQSVGRLVAGDILVSNFNDKANVQGTGTTLVEISPAGKLIEFAKLSSLPAGTSCPGGVGLGTGLAILPGGWTVVGSIPAAGPSGAPANANPNGCLLVFDSSGKVVRSWTSPDINGPWDLAAAVNGDKAAIFVSNVLTRPAKVKDVPKTGECGVARIDVTLGAGVPRMTSATAIGSAYPWAVNKPTFILGPTGLALGSNGTLYVAQTLGNEVGAISDAMTRTTPSSLQSSVITKGGFLNAPLGMTMAPNGDILVTNGNDGNLVEITPQGRQFAKNTLVKNGAGDLFGITLSADGKGIVFVNDGANAIDRATAG